MIRVDIVLLLLLCRGSEWSYLRGGLTTLDHDYGVFNKIHHDIGTHVAHHLVSFCLFLVRIYEFVTGL
jgi:hypothetical protein